MNTNTSDQSMLDKSMLDKGMSDKNALIDRLETLGVLRSVDAALGRLLASIAGHNGGSIGVAAALVSAALAAGHSCLPLAALHDFATAKVLDDPRTVEALLRELPTYEFLRDALLASPLVSRDGSAAAALALDKHDRLFLQRYFNYEQGIAQALLARTCEAEFVAADTAALRRILARYFDVSLVDDTEQRIAVLLALRSRFLIVTGGPGTGKTSTVLRLIAIAIEQALDAGQTPPRIALTAPTGKAAARLSETLRVPMIDLSDAVRSALPQTATTLHRLIGAIPGRTQPRYDLKHPLPYDLVVVDEASMLDLALAARLCDALTAQTRLVLLGDRDQLASVEAGSVFGALCAAAGTPNCYSQSTTMWLESILSAKIGQVAHSTATSNSPPPLSNALVELRSSHRFGVRSGIGRFAQAVRSGASVEALALLDQAFLELHAQPIGETALTQELMVRVLPHFSALAASDSPARALDRLDRFRVLCALREGPFGATTINATIAHALRRHSAHVDAHGWFPGRLVMIASNDYRQSLFNGDIGVALATGAHGAIEVWFRSADGTARALPPPLLPAFEHAFAMTVHKAQGSEFDDVLIVLPTRDARVLTRELLYTAVTRARKKVELWTTQEILSATIVRSTQRWSGLAEALGSPVAARAERARGLSDADAPSSV